MDIRYKTKDEIDINELITEIEKWSKPCRVLTENHTLEYYSVNGMFYREDENCEEVILDKEELFEELSNYNEQASTRFVNENVVIFDLTI